MKHRLERELHQALIAAEMLAFHPSESSYRFAAANEKEEPVVVPIADIRPAIRNEGIECINAERGALILNLIKRGKPLHPIVVNAPPDLQPPYRYSLYDGYHRLNISVALGYSHIPVVIRPWFDFNAL